MRPIIFCALLIFSAITTKAQDDPEEVEKKEVYEIRSLTKMATSENYGLTGENPVKVGKGPAGGPANQRAFLDLLRDEQGNPLKYEREGSCCQYKSDNAPFGFALVDRYRVKYKDRKGKKKETIIYISFYDYEEPMIPQGFSSSSIDGSDN